MRTLSQNNIEHIKSLFDQILDETFSKLISNDEFNDKIVKELIALVKSGDITKSDRVIEILKLEIDNEPQ